YAFLALPLDEIRNQHVALEALWGPAAGALREQLIAADGAEARLRLLERFLLSRAPEARPRHPAVARAVAAFCKGPHRVGDVVGDSGLASRRFIRLFNEQVGLTPKAFCRIRRFQRTVALLHRADAVDWADTAVACGY